MVSGFVLRHLIYKENIYKEILQTIYKENKVTFVTYPFELTIVLAGQQTVMNPGAGQASFVNQLETARLKAIQNNVCTNESCST